MRKGKAGKGQHMQQPVQPPPGQTIQPLRRVPRDRFISRPVAAIFERGGAAPGAPEVVVTEGKAWLSAIAANLGYEPHLVSEVLLRCYLPGGGKMYRLAQYSGGDTLVQALWTGGLADQPKPPAPASQKLAPTQPKRGTAHQQVRAEQAEKAKAAVERCRAAIAKNKAQRLAEQKAAGAKEKEAATSSADPAGSAASKAALLGPEGRGRGEEKEDPEQADKANKPAGAGEVEALGGKPAPDQPRAPSPVPPYDGADFDGESPPMGAAEALATVLPAKAVAPKPPPPPQGAGVEAPKA